MFVELRLKFQSMTSHRCFVGSESMDCMLLHIFWVPSNYSVTYRAFERGYITERRCRFTFLRVFPSRCPKSSMVQTAVPFKCLTMSGQRYVTPLSLSINSKELFLLACRRDKCPSALCWLVLELPLSLQRLKTPSFWLTCLKITTVSTIMKYLFPCI